MAITFSADLPLLRYDDAGAIRVGNTNVLWELVIEAAIANEWPSTIIAMYPSLSLKQVYSAIAYALTHPEDYETYIRDRKQFLQAVNERAASLQSKQ